MEDAGFRTEPPVYVPTSWTLAPAFDEAAALAVGACGEVTALAAERRKLALAMAVCRLVEERLAASDDQTALLLSLSARILDATAKNVVGDDLEAVLIGSACRRAAEACRTALVSLFLEGD